MIFVDTSAIITLFVPGDTFHTRAIRWREENKNLDYILSNLIFVETTSWIRYKYGKKLAVEVGINLLSGKGISIHRLIQDDEMKAWELFKKTKGRGVSMVDCTSIVLMKRLKIKDIFTFDEDFKKLGFIVYPDLL